MIDQQTIDKVIDTAQIVDVVSDFVTLRRRGVNYIGLCPFHPDKSPSFNVSPAKNICKCFSCGEGGSPVTFLMKKEQMTFYEAIRWLGKKYGIEVEDKKMNDEERQQQTDREGMFNLNEFAQKCFEEDLFDTPEGRNVGLAYFRERGIQDATIHRYHLGYALEDKYNLASRALQHGHKREYLLDGTGVGLCFGDDPKKTPVCRFAGRVIFPHHSLSGKCIAFGGRILQRVDHAFKKYVNSPESAIYHKSDLPYGLFEAKNEMAKQDLCYVVEGNVDVLSMSQAGFQNVIAASGTALTSEHIRIIKRFTRNCALMFDADNAGITAAIKSIDLLLLEGMNVRILTLPEGEDPDSFCRKHTSEEVDSYFKANMEDFISFKIKTLMKDVNPYDPYAMAKVAQNVCNSVALIADPITSSILVGRVAQSLNLSEQQTMRYVNQAKQNNYQAEVRRMEVEMRREQAAREREELGVTKPAVITPSNNSDYSEFSEGSEYSENSGKTESTQPTPAQPRPSYVSQVTDRFERNIIKHIVRHGGETFTFSYFNQEEKKQESIEVRVIDFIYNELNADEVTFKHPLYARMYNMALEASADENVTWDSVRFFSNIFDDIEVQQTAVNLMQDRYDALGVAENVERLDILVPRSILELKNCILEQEIDAITQALRTAPDPNKCIELMQELNEKRNIKKYFDKELGERVIIPGRR
ncbi:MAG: DNA primase [Bacteroidales bacterium]|nr:DNA primase [Bacteroidales bacterium]